MRVRRLPVIDEYVAGDEAVVFAAGQVVALSELATAVLFAIESPWTEQSTIAVELVARFGDPAQGTDPMELTRTTLESLIELRLVECE